MPRNVVSAPSATLPRFSPRSAMVDSAIECIAELRFYVDMLEGRQAIVAQAMPFSLRKIGDTTTLQAGANALVYADIDGVSTGVKEPITIRVANGSFEIAPTRSVSRRGSRQALRSALIADVLGVAGVFTDLGSKLPQGNLASGPIAPALADLFVAQFVALSPHAAERGPGKADLLSVQEYDGTTLARIEFSAPLTWSPPGSNPSEVVGEALIRLDGFVHSVTARALNRPKTKREVGDAETAFHLRCRDSSEEAPP